MTQTDFTDASQVLQLFDQIQSRIEELKKPIRQAFVKEVLPALQGKTYGTFEQNRDIANGLRDLLYELDLRIECSNPDCKQPAILVCRKPARAEHGLFQCEHPANGGRATHGAFRSLPDILKPVDPPADGRRSRGRK